MTYTVYKHTGPTGKVYIGVTCLPLAKRWGLAGQGYKRNPRFWADILRLGWDAFTHEILAEGLTKQEADRQEVALIAQYDSTNPTKGYNLDNGGDTGRKHSDETRRKIGEANRARVWTPEARAKVGASSSGRIPTEETRLKMSEAHRGPKNHNYGKQFSEETRAKLRAAWQRRKGVIP